MSVDYYIRLEQGRGPRPSRQVLSALARALLLNGDEREYLFLTAGESPPQPARPGREITPGIRHLLDGMPATPAYVVDAAYNILAWNQLAVPFIGNHAGWETDRNMIRWMFRRPATDTIWSDADSVRFTRSTVADLRASYARYPGDPEIDEPGRRDAGAVTAVRGDVVDHDVEVRGPMLKRIGHPRPDRSSSSARCCTSRRPASGSSRTARRPAPRPRPRSSELAASAPLTTRAR